MADLIETLSSAFSQAISTIVNFLPDLFAGLIILLVGWLIASLLRTLIMKGLKALNFGKWLEKTGIEKRENKDVWINIIAQVVFWTILIFLLIPTFEAWNIPQVNVVINELLFYLPKVIAAVIVGFVGVVVANLVADVVRNAARSLEGNAEDMLAGVAKYSILTFAGLIVLEQLGIAPTLINIFFTGIMIAFALAIGLAFGLGGRDKASELLEKMGGGLRKKVKK